MEPFAILVGVGLALLGFGVYQIGVQEGRAQVRKLVRFGVDPEAWELEDRGERVVEARG